MSRYFLAYVLSFCAGVEFASAQSSEQKVRDDKAKVEADGFWIYNDLARFYGGQGIEQAADRGVALRSVRGVCEAGRRIGG